MPFRQNHARVKNLDAGALDPYRAEHPDASYTLLDVRTPGEYEAGHIPGAVLVPVSELADNLDRIDPDKTVIAYCASGNRSRAASELLTGQGYKDVFNLAGGFQMWMGREATGGPEFGLFVLKDSQSPEELLKAAYGLEEGLRIFYDRMADAAASPDAQKLFRQLMGYEELHKNRIFQIMNELEGAKASREELEQAATGAYLEGGGLTVEDAVEQFAGKAGSQAEVLDLAIAIEAQGLDLYLRFARSNPGENAGTIAFQIAEDEKKHLAALEKLRETITG